MRCFECLSDWHTPPTSATTTTTITMCVRACVHINDRKGVRLHAYRCLCVLYVDVLALINVVASVCILSTNTRICVSYAYVCLRKLASRHWTKRAIVSVSLRVRAFRSDVIRCDDEARVFTRNVVRLFCILLRARIHSHLRAITTVLFGHARDTHPHAYVRYNTSINYHFATVCSTLQRTRSVAVVPFPSGVTRVRNAAAGLMIYCNVIELYLSCLCVSCSFCTNVHH